MTVLFLLLTYSWVGWMLEWGWGCSVGVLGVLFILSTVCTWVGSVFIVLFAVFTEFTVITVCELDVGLFTVTLNMVGCWVGVVIWAVGWGVGALGGCSLG